MERCAAAGQVAANIMRMRQNGLPPTETFAQISKGAPDNIAQALQQLVMLAYDRPKMRVAENQQDEVDRFRSDMETICLKGD